MSREDSLKIWHWEKFLAGVAEGYLGKARVQGIKTKNILLFNKKPLSFDITLSVIR